MSLSRKDGRQTLSPRLLDGRQNPQLVVHQHVMLRRVTALYVCQLLLLMNVYEYVPADRLEETRALNLSRLKDHVAVGKDDHRAPLLAALQHVQRIGQEP